MEEAESFSEEPLTFKPNVDTSLLQFNAHGKEMLRFMPNGDIFVYGRLADNDMEVVEGIKAFLKDSGYMKPKEEGPQDI